MVNNELNGVGTPQVRRVYLELSVCPLAPLSGNSPMTMRERMLAVIQGEPLDRVPFVQYCGLAAPDDEIRALVGRENMGLIRWSSVHRLETPNCVVSTEDYDCRGRRAQRSHLKTSRGVITQERVFEPTFGTAATHKHYVCEPADYEILLAYLRDVIVVEDASPYVRDDGALGADGLAMVAVLRTPYQQMWVQWVSLENLAWHLADDLPVLHECLEALADIERRVFRAVLRAAERNRLPFVNVPDNITAPAIGDRYFRKYCLPMYNELAGMLEEKGVPVFVHMDGDLKPLWKAISESEVRGLDSFSSPPDNDTSCREAATLWPQMRLLANFPSSVHLREPEEVYAHTMAMLGEAGHTGRLQIQISENVPPGVWRSSFPAITRAISDFGKP